MTGRETYVAAVVGIDGSGKSSACRGALEQLALSVDVVGIGDECLAGAPGVPVHVRRDVPLRRLSRAVLRSAKATRHVWAYRQLKTLDLIGRSRTREQVVRDERPDVLLTDGDPLLNTMAWSAARLYRDQLGRDDERVLDALRYLSGQARIPRSELRFYLRHAWQLAAVNRVGLRFAMPDLVVLLQIDGTSAMERIGRRGQVRQAHETVPALDDLAAGYERICGLIESCHGVRVVRVAATRTGQEEVAALVTEAVLDAIEARPDLRVGDPEAAPIEVVATTISGSLADQRKIHRIVPQFAAVTRQPVRLHAVDSHAEAEATTNDIVARGGRVIVSAGGGGTFNAVLEGSHQAGTIPSEVRLAFLRKGSADLIGKTLRISDELPAAVSAIVDGIEHDRRLRADVIAVDTVGPHGEARTRHLIGFGGLGIFGDVPRFTEARWVKFYKGIIGSIAGDYGPFYVGLALATAQWSWLRLWGHVAPLVLELDGEAVGPDRWIAVIVVGADLGPDFPLGRGVSFASGDFRVVALRDRGLPAALRQLAAARSGAIFDAPARYDSVVRDVRVMVVRTPTHARGSRRPLTVNIDGLPERSHGPVRFAISGQVRLIIGP